MRPITGADIINFYASHHDLLALTAAGEFAHLDDNEINEAATAYNFATTAEGAEVQILLTRSTIIEGEFFDALDEDGNLIPSVADEMAEVINGDGILPQAVHQAKQASAAWETANAEAAQAAANRSQAVAAVVAFTGGNQSEAGRLLGLDQSTVNKLVKKTRANR